MVAIAQSRDARFLVDHNVRPHRSVDALRKGGVHVQALRHVILPTQPKQRVALFQQQTAAVRLEHVEQPHAASVGYFEQQSAVAQLRVARPQHDEVCGPLDIAAFIARCFVDVRNDAIGW